MSVPDLVHPTVLVSVKILILILHRKKTGAPRHLMRNPVLFELCLTAPQTTKSVSVYHSCFVLLKEGCGFFTQGRRSQIYKLAKRHGHICLAGTGEIPIAGTAVLGLSDRLVEEGTNQEGRLSL